MFLNKEAPAKKYAIVLFNIKGYKGINEIFGTSGGDEALQIHTHCGVYLITDRSVAVSTMCDCAKLAISNIFDEYIKCYAVFDSHMRREYIINLEIRGRIQEALIRRNYPQHGLISPGVFIPVPEESGYISEVDHFVLDEVRRLYEKRKNEGKRVAPISVNLSWMDFFN